MPRTKVVFYREDDGAVPLIEWLDGLPVKVRVKCRIGLARLAMLGHELRRPQADYLRDGIYELRVSYRRVQYRMLYFFHEQAAAVVSHGIVKEQRVPPREIDRVVELRRQFIIDPQAHSLEGLVP